LVSHGPITVISDDLVSRGLLYDKKQEFSAPLPSGS
jgi:hypothetical protein